MTTAERETAFKAALAEAEERFGIALKPAILSERLGDAHLHRPALALVDLAESAGWTPPIHTLMVRRRTDAPFVAVHDAADAETPGLRPEAQRLGVGRGAVAILVRTDRSRVLICHGATEADEPLPCLCFHKSPRPANGARRSDPPMRTRRGLSRSTAAALV